jgi:hypothetical protein
MALINNLKRQLISKLIRSNPSSLGIPDHLNRTPLEYAVLKAEHLRNKEIDGTWSIPTSKTNMKWQQDQRAAWENVEIILEAMVKRRIPVSVVHERSVLISCVEYLAPPAVVNQMITLGGKILREDAHMAKQMVESVCRFQYPTSVLKRVIKGTSKSLSKAILLWI